MLAFIMLEERERERTNKQQTTEVQKATKQWTVGSLAVVLLLVAFQTRNKN
jgi:hypothetical protein